MGTYKMVVLITGANKGIGFETVKRFAENKYNQSIILTARNEKLGLEAVDKIKTEFPEAKVEFFKLDISENDAGIKTAKYIKEHHSKISILINNAAIAYKAASTAPVSEQAKVTNDVNYFATKDFTLQLLDNDAVAPNGKVLICSSLASDMSIVKCHKDVQNMIIKSFNNVAEIDNMVNDFI